MSDYTYLRTSGALSIEARDERIVAEKLIEKLENTPESRDAETWTREK